MSENQMKFKDEKDALERIQSQIMKIKGVIGVARLTPEQCRATADLEEEAMQHVLGGIGKGRNEGLKKALGYKIVMVLFTDVTFEMTRDPGLILLICDKELAGFGTTDPEVIARFKKDKEYLVFGDFLVMKRGARINSSAFACGDAYFLFNGTTNESLSKIEQIKDHFVAIPSPPAFGFLKEQFKDKINLDNPQAAGFVVGMELKN